jgi:choline dehydrogenase-like flavoprotein
MACADHFGLFYVAVKGNGKGFVRPSLVDPKLATTRYELSPDDLKSLGVGLARLSMILLAAGASEIHTSVQGMPPIRTQREAIRWLDERLPRSRLSLTTVHLFASCPSGERRDRCAVDSFGRVFGMDNLYINDASMLPDSPGVNPQATVMAMARRNALRTAEELGV